MPAYKVDDIRNVSLLGHGGSGKTTLTDHILHMCGVTSRAGSVDEGTSVSDYDPEEKERQFSIDSSVFQFEHAGKHYNWIDTPGYPDFVADAQASLSAVETALICISAQAGIQLNTRKLWAASTEAGLARAILITRMDGENIQFEALISSVRETFGTQCACLFLPVGVGNDFSGVVNLLTADSAPDGVLGDFDEMKSALRDSIVESDEELMMKFLEEEEISQEELIEALKKSVVGGTLVPILFCAAGKNAGVKELMEFLSSSCPSPAEGVQRNALGPQPEPEPVEEGEEPVIPERPTVELSTDPEAPFIGQVFKISTGKHVGKVAVIRVMQGTMQAGDQPLNVRADKNERLSHINTIQGAELEETEEAIAGDMFAVAKVETLQVGDTLREPKFKAEMPQILFPNPMMSYAVEPKSRNDEQRIFAGLAKLAEADPTFQIGRDEQTNELVITGMSTLHLDVMLSRLKRSYDVEVETRPPAIPYKETITRTAQASYRHKKQTGGSGEFAEVHLRLEPMERGDGFEFVDEVTGGSIPKQYIPACEKGIRETLVRGVLAGYPVVDLRAAVFFGKDHPVDSSEGAFKKAASMAFKEAFSQCGGVLLEPIVKLDVTVPSEFMGEITGHLSGHRGRILGMDAIGDMQIVRAVIPMAEISSYSTELKSMTQGQGSFSMEFSHYDIVPQFLVQQIVEKAKREKEEE